MSDYIIGINYEGGKIIDHILQYSQCVGFANCQIAMDAPYEGRVANEDIRSQGRSETQFVGYDEYYLIDQLSEIFSSVLEKFGETKIVIQISRGRSGKTIFNEILLPILLKLNIINYVIKYGYRSDDYYKPQIDSSDFIFINIGMFAVLQYVNQVKICRIFNPIKAYKINSYINNEFQVSNDVFFYDNNPKNLLNKLGKIIIVGIANDMKFVTPDIYSCESKDKLLNFLFINN